MWVSSVKLVFNSNDLSLHHFLSSYFQIQRGESLLSPGLAVPKLGCMLDSIRKYYMFWCPGTPRPVKSEVLEVGSMHWLFLRLPSDSITHPSLRTSALFGLRSTLKGVLHPSLFPSPFHIFSLLPPPLLLATTNLFYESMKMVYLFIRFYIWERSPRICLLCLISVIPLLLAMADFYH